MTTPAPSVLAAQLILQQQIVREVSDPNSTVASVVAVLWSAYANKVAIHPELQYLYVKRSCLDIRLAEEQDDTDVGTLGDLQIKRSQMFTHLDTMRMETQTDILRIEAIAQSSRGPRAGALTSVAPTLPPDPNGYDANNPMYQGSPYPVLSPYYPVITDPT